MKPTGFLCFVWVALFSFACSGCLSFPNSPVPKFYTLHSTDNSKENKILDIAPKLIIGIGPVEIPEYDRPARCRCQLLRSPTAWVGPRQ